MIDTKGRYRRNGKNVYIKQPEFKELEFVSKLWSDSDTMNEIGGTFNFPKEKWSNFYKKMIYPTDGKNFYCLIYRNDNVPVGEVSFHGYDSITKVARFNVKILKKYRDNGYGEEGIRLLLEYYFFEFCGAIVIDSVSTPSAIKVLSRIGFQVIRQFKNETTMKLLKEDFINNKRYSNKKIGILMYKGMNMLDFNMNYNILKKANSINGSNLFDLYCISIDKEVDVEDSNISILIKNNNINIEDRPDILIIPGGKQIISKYNPYIKQILEECDFICAQGSGIKFLIECNYVDGIFIPIDQVDRDDSKFINDNMLIKDNFSDNGKIMLSSNIIGQIEMLMTLIYKLGGRNLAEETKKKIGLK